MKKRSLFDRLVLSENIERPFFLFLTLMLVGIYILGLKNSPTLHSAWEIFAFTVLMAIHIAFYWISPWIFGHRQWLALYLILQCLIIFSLGMLCRVIGVVMGLFPGLVGLMIGMPVRRGWKFPAIGLVLALSAFSFSLLTSPSSLGWWALATIPIVVFISLYVLMYLRQVAAREQAQALLRDLEAANRQLTEYAARVEDLTISAERQRMARELHDTLSQGLAGLILQLEAVDAHLAAKRVERGRLILKQSMEKARGTLADARRAIDDLRQPTSRDLPEAVREEATRFTSATGIACEPEIEISGEIPQVVAETSLRAVAEALTNIARHAGARNVSLRLTGTENRLEIEICDDGVGFDPQAVEAGHYGLLGMGERVRLAGGSLEVRSGPGKGTCLSIRFPLEGSRDA